MFQPLPPPCSTVWADINSEMRMTSSYIQPNHHKWHDINSSRQRFFVFFFLGSSPFCLSLWFCALVIWPSRLYSHCEAEEQKDGSNSFCATPQARLFFPSAHYLRPDSASQQDSAPFRSGPDPPYSRGLRLADDPLRILSAPPAIIRGTPLHLQEKMAASQSVRLG